MKTLNNKINTGNSGEYFVAAELERRGFTCAVPMSGVKDFDILAINNKTHKQYAIQVKTTLSRKREWVLSAKNEDLVADNIVYVFVCLNEFDTPEYFIVPSRIVAGKIVFSHRKWLNTVGKNGRAHKDSPMRKFSDEDEFFKSNWALFE